MKTLNPINSGKTLITACESISIDQLVREYEKEFKSIFITSKIEANGYDIEIKQEKTGFNGSRLWFKCPLCKQSKGKIYKHPIEGIIGCRNCLKLEYKSRI